MPQTLVVCYSRSGTSQKAAKWIAQRLGAQLEIIEPVDRFTGFFGMFRSLFAALAGKQPLIVMGLHPAKFDRGIMVAPIWAGKVAPPMSTWAAKQFGARKELILVTVSSSGNGEEAARELAKANGITLAHSLHLTRRQVNKQPLDQVFGALLGTQEP